VSNQLKNNSQETPKKIESSTTTLSLEQIQQLLIVQGKQRTNDEINFVELWTALIQKKLFISIVCAVFAIASVIFALSKPNVYKASVLLSPASSSDSSGGLSALAGQFGGLAGMAGISLGKGSADKTAVALEIIKSRSFIKHFITKYELLIPLMAGEEWDSSTETLLLDAEVYDQDNKSWIKGKDSTKENIPTLWQAYRQFSKLLTVSQDQTTSMVTIQLEFFSPVLAQKWLTLLVSDINQYIREQEKEEAQNSIDFLTKKLESIKINNMEAVFYQLIEEQTKNMMLIEVKPEYVLKTIDPAEIPDMKAKPQRALIVLLGTIFGLMLSVIFVLTRHFTQKLTR
jgi:uncharacterized protein involved in exopolysaccharide biosynthesis